VIMKVRIIRLITAMMLVTVTIQGVQTARADSTLWYNGDSDGRDGLVNQTGGPQNPPDGYVYDNFIVPAGQTWSLTSVFSNDLLSVTPNTAYWEIRSGVSAGNGGTLLYSGDGTDSQIATTKSYNFSGNPLLPPIAEYTNTVSVSGVTLGPGTYWLAVVPDVGGLNQLYGAAATVIDTTSGVNAIGIPPGNDGNSFLTSTFFGDNFVPLSTIEGDTTQNWDVSMGVRGTVTFSTIPEPSSIVCGLTGLVLAAGYVRHRHRKGAGPVRPMEG
jgi:hypothetical protein